MKLSEAIRLGAMMKPQGYNEMFYNGKTCALGAALDAVGELGKEGLVTKLAVHWPWLVDAVTCPPADLSGMRDSVTSIIVHLNDRKTWTREHIADWVATVEPQEHIAQVTAAQEDLTGAAKA